jgi:hypothetical protein
MTEQIIKEISTHKAVKENGVINIYETGLDIDAKDKDGNPEWDDDFIKTCPNCFKDVHIGTLRLEQEDDILAIFDGFEETNRINCAQASEEFQTK